MNPIDLFNKFKWGLKNLTLAQQLEAKIAGLYGNIIGMFCGTITMLIYVFYLKEYQWWWTTLILSVGCYLNIIDLIATKQQYEQAWEIQDMMNQTEVKQ